MESRLEMKEAIAQLEATARAAWDPNPARSRARLRVIRAARELERAEHAAAMAHIELKMLEVELEMIEAGVCD
jgi:hypothetical protein